MVRYGRDASAMMCKCGNSARYITARGEFTCSLCPLRERVDSVRISDVPALLAWVRGFIEYGWSDPQNMRELLGRDVER